jgi:phage baseplate assembly protein W
LAVRLRLDGILMKAPFYGRGLAFPFRINPVTGGAQITEGSDDTDSIGIEFVRDQYSIREKMPDRSNHIGEAIEHILLTRPMEHDTLPEFGSRLFTLLNKPNHPQTAMEFEVWAEESIKRWEKRAKLPRNGGTVWTPTGQGIDEGELPVTLHPQVVTNQVPANLVSPFVTTRQARLQEYPSTEMDPAGHDWTSRFRDSTVYERNGEQFIRPRRALPLAERNDDQFYKVKYGDTWLLISFEVYGDIRFHWIVSDLAAQDAAARGESRDRMDNTGDPEPGALLRLPSRTRLLMEIL